MAGPNQYDDLGGMDGCDAAPAGFCMTRTLPFDGLAEWCVEKENAETDSRRELAREVIQELPSFNASMSSVAKDGRGFSSIPVAGGQGSRISLSAARLRLIMTNVPMRQPKATVLAMDIVVEYAKRPTKKLGTLVAASTAEIAVPVMTRRAVGAQIIQWPFPRATERPMRTWTRVRRATTNRHVCLRVRASQSLTAEAGSDATA